MRMMKLAAAMAGLALVAGCAPTYTLVGPAPVRVARNSMRVTPGSAWNKAPVSGLLIPEAESWTQNGLLLDEISFVGGLAPGKAITRQRRKADQKVPTFTAGMSPQDLVAMVETLHRIRGDAVFETVALAPRPFLGATGLQYDYAFVGADEVKRRGRAVLAVVGERLYLIALEGASSHYFDAALPEFERLATGAALG
jgi:hypothetical protein